jgi:glutathione synthase/RimK-type ligase-like ATP-grasp enzyme
LTLPRSEPAADRELLMNRFLKARFRRRLAGSAIGERIASLIGRLLSPAPVPPDGEDDPIESAEILDLSWPPGVRKPLVGVVRDVPSRYPWWPKYARFLNHQGVPYELFSMDSSNWTTIVRRFDLVVWHSFSDPFSRWEAETKTHFLERELKIPCLPSERELWAYENKERQALILAQAELPRPATFVSHDLEESLAFVRTARYPLVTKIVTGSGSLGVSLIESSLRAERFCRRAFSEAGVRTYWPALNQRRYVYFQESISNAGHDLRVIVAGDRCFGYYRFPEPGEFRASGSKKWDWGPLPEEALDLAVRVYRAAGCRSQMAVDMLFDHRDGRYKVIEFSIFFVVDSARQLRVGGLPGAYRREREGWKFEPGRYWVQDFGLRTALGAFTNAESEKATHAADPR